MERKRSRNHQSHGGENVNWMKKITVTALPLISVASLAIPTAMSAGQMAPRSAVSVVAPGSESVVSLQMDVTHKITRAWSESKDASGAAAFKENGDIALNDGHPEQARRYFEAAEEELAHLSPVVPPASTF